ncbi:peptidyl-tRNA hydrolase, PTH1 family [Solimonas aquatica]|uniref:Peptidyl-tRNA hydrolase n=1 Tax=Solimonas aquatica TaxID=489703 RepID=A0A1H9DRT5_9GAMM|nr:aminoacyl-tRNA hydrolase [Solimonas aquatica]SEQ16017.1 peptidyl-tRNA hydrolase, PTH1 family [Solimonas aquatica]
MSASTLHAIVGLGNPGGEYEKTRHNAGFWFVDRLAEAAGSSLRTEAKFHGQTARIKLGGHEVLLLKPGTFMNRSGQAVQALAQFYKLPPEAILVAHDELDLPAGAMRLKLGGGHGGHNGLRDVHKVLGDQYRRLRIGIGHPGDKNLVLGYVLGRPSREDESAIAQGLTQAQSAVETWLRQGWERAMHQLHSETKAAKP